MVQQPKETRRCIVCGSTDVVVDVYKVENIQYFSGVKQAVGKPMQYCEKHFMSEVWNKGKV